MKPQETAQERAEKYSSTQAHGNVADRNCCIKDFLAGEESAQSRIKTLESVLVDMAKALKENYYHCAEQCRANDGWAKKCSCGAERQSKHARELLKNYQGLLSEIRKDGK